MKQAITIIPLILIMFAAGIPVIDGGVMAEQGAMVALPRPAGSAMPLNDAVRRRRTRREFNPNARVTLQELSSLLFAMQGHTDGAKRTVPSARAVYPLEIYAAVNNVTGLAGGLYKMDIAGFGLRLMRRGDIGDALSAACMGQQQVKKSQVRIVIACRWERLTAGMGEEAKKWGYFEAGGASQNGYLMAAALGLNAVPVGGMDTRAVAKILGLDHERETPIIVNCFGR